MGDLLEVKNLSVSFASREGRVYAVRGISFRVGENRSVAIVGESGCGKSVTARAILGLIEAPGEIGDASSIRFAGKELTGSTEKEWRAYRGNEAAMIFQDALAALNPTMKVGRQIAESLVNHKALSAAERKHAALCALTDVGIPDAERCLNLYPHELSGGMRQRVMIASAMITRPKLMIADEPTTALDVTIQAQILELMKELQKRREMSSILITHDLGVVADYADEIFVMYAGKIVERGLAEDIFYRPAHPYTWALIHAAPNLRMDKRALLPAIPGAVPDMRRPPDGCAFAGRCPYAMRICQKAEPSETEILAGHTVCCWLQHEKADRSDVRFLNGGTGR